MGLGTALLLLADHGSDGYSMMVRGLALQSGWPYWSVSACVGALIAAAAWIGGVRPGLSTFAAPLLAGITVSAVLLVAPDVNGAQLRSLCVLASMPILCVGVAAYLAADYGAAPAEAAALALSHHIPFAVTLAAIQVVAACVGWLTGATLGVGTVLFTLVFGPMVAWFGKFLSGPQ